VKGKNLRNGSRITDYGLLSLGDLVISLPQAKRQSAAYGASFYEELSRLLVHGLLHLLDYDHERNAYQAQKMRTLESEVLKALWGSGV
jgi:rRNA maturation RNase YbeY